MRPTQQRGRRRSLRTRNQRSRARHRLTAAAFHEAGHAVAAYHVRIRFRRLAIGEDGPGELGWLELWLAHSLAADGLADLRTEQVIERSVIVLLAGAAAEQMALGRARYLGSGLDFYEAVRYAGHLCRTRAETSAYLRWMQLRVRALVATRSWRDPIEALAGELLRWRHLGAREARAIIHRAVRGRPRFSAGTWR